MIIRGLQHPNVPKVVKKIENNGKNLVFPCSLTDLQVFDLKVITELTMNPVRTPITIRFVPIRYGKNILKSGEMVNRKKFELVTMNSCENSLFINPANKNKIPEKVIDNRILSPVKDFILFGKLFTAPFILNI